MGKCQKLFVDFGNLSIRKHQNQIKCQVEKKCLSSIVPVFITHHYQLNLKEIGIVGFSIGQVGHVENEIIEFFALKMHLDRKQDRTYGFWKYSEEQLKNYTEELKTKLNKTNLNVVSVVGTIHIQIHTTVSLSHVESTLTTIDIVSSMKDSRDIYKSLFMCLLVTKLFILICDKLIAPKSSSKLIF